MATIFIDNRREIFLAAGIPELKVALNETIITHIPGYFRIKCFYADDVAENRRNVEMEMNNYDNHMWIVADITDGSDGLTTFIRNYSVYKLHDAGILEDSDEAIADALLYKDFVDIPFDQNIIRSFIICIQCSN
jgi:hypothetical protein